MAVTMRPHMMAYMSEGQQNLIKQGYYLLEHVEKDKQVAFNDYSFVVFPFAKAYEGFLKEFFLDIGFITEKDYFSDHFRVGKVLSPHLAKQLKKKSVYQRVSVEMSRELADNMWETWKNGRNEVFHYFPHNLRSLTLDEAKDIIFHIVNTMEKALESMQISKLKKRLSDTGKPQVNVL